MADPKNTMGNQYWNGSNGKVWVNDEHWESVSGFECKVSPEYEEIPEGLTTVKVPVGYKVSGTIKMRRKGSTPSIISRFAPDIKNGIIPDVKIVAKAENKATGANERVSVTGVTFNDFDLNSFELKKVAEIDLPFDAVDFDVAK